VRVLIADDNSEKRSALGLFLRELWPDCEVDEVRDGTEALCSLRARSVDLVLLDWELPGVEAPAFIDELGRCLPGCAVIAMSSDPAARERSQAAGVSYFVGTNDPPQRLLELLDGLGLSGPDGSWVGVQGER
jgi:two-component system response regulator DesR